MPVVSVHGESQVKLQLKQVPAGHLVMGTHTGSWQCGSAQPLKFHPPEGFGHTPMCLLQHRQDLTRCLLGTLQTSRQMIVTYSETQFTSVLPGL